MLPTSGPAGKFVVAEWRETGLAGVLPWIIGLPVSMRW